MLNYDRAAILEYLSQHVSANRLQHCLGVEKIALQLAPRFGVSLEMVSVGALLHDLCREYHPELLLQLAGNFGIVIDDIEKAEPLLLHGAVAAMKIQNELNITAAEILNAIQYHITGGPHLSELAKLVFVADFIEPGRTHEHAQMVRDQAFMIAPEVSLLKVYHCTISYVVGKSYLLHPRTVEGRNELIMKGIRI